MSKISKKLAREKTTVEKMIGIYCNHHHQTSKNQICTDCASLLDYALLRIERCPFGARKPTCAKCPIHCYKPEMREKIRDVMRYAGPRMLFYHPGLAILHIIDRLRKPPTLKKQ
jgi:hypothetical protein